MLSKLAVPVTITLRTAWVATVLRDAIGSDLGWLGSSREERMASPQALSVWGLVARKARYSTPATHLPNLFLGASQRRKFAQTLEPTRTSTILTLLAFDAVVSVEQSLLVEALS